MSWDGVSWDSCLPACLRCARSLFLPRPTELSKAAVAAASLPPYTLTQAAVMGRDWSRPRGPPSLSLSHSGDRDEYGSIDGS